METLIKTKVNIFRSVRLDTFGSDESDIVACKLDYPSSNPRDGEANTRRSTMKD